MEDRNRRCDITKFERYGNNIIGICGPFFVDVVFAYSLGGAISPVWMLHGGSP